MFISEEGKVTGSVNRVELAAAYEQATDEAVRANLAAVGAEHGMHIEDGRLVDPSIPLLTDAELTALAEAETEREADDQAAQSREGRPAINDNKAAWVDWAVNQGLDRELAESATKAELIEDYGE